MKRARSFNIVTGVEVRPTLDASTQEDIDNWDKSDQWCQENILNTVILQGVLAYTETSAELWSTLENKFRKRGHNALYTGLVRLIATKYIEGQDMDTHLTKLRMCYEELAKIGKVISDEYLFIFILNSLPRSWSNVNMWFEQAHSKPEYVATSSQAICQIKNEAQHRQTAAISVNSNQVTTKTNAGALATSQPIKCTHCNKKGQNAAECYKNPNNPNNRLGKMKDRQIRHDSSHALDPRFWCCSSSHGRCTSIIDVVSNPLAVETASGQPVVCLGYGAVILKATSGQEIHLKNVYHLPGATSGLVSVRFLASIGFCVTFGLDGLCSISKGNTLIVETRPDTAYDGAADHVEN